MADFDTVAAASATHVTKYQGNIRMCENAECLYELASTVRSSLLRP